MDPDSLRRLPEPRQQVVHETAQEGRQQLEIALTPVGEQLPNAIVRQVYIGVKY
jgi:hypothetical protein